VSIERILIALAALTLTVLGLELLYNVLAGLISSG
jgi:hypothetical protein